MSKLRSTAGPVTSVTLCFERRHRHVTPVRSVTTRHGRPVDSRALPDAMQQTVQREEPETRPAYRQHYRISAASRQPRPMTRRQRHARSPDNESESDRLEVRQVIRIWADPGTQHEVSVAIVKKGSVLVFNLSLPNGHVVMAEGRLACGIFEYLRQKKTSPAISYP